MCAAAGSRRPARTPIFESYRSTHHPDAAIRLPLAAAYLNGELDDQAARRTLRHRDRVLWLEMESSSLAGILIEPLASACPTKTFILTIRDVYSWCDSWINHNLSRPPSHSAAFATLDQLRLRVADFEPTRFDAPLIARGCSPLACFFQLLADHNERVIETVPSSRLLIVPTSTISTRLPEIATWAGVPLETLRADRIWL